MSQSETCPVSSIASDFDSVSAAREAADLEVIRPETGPTRKTQLRRDLSYLDDRRRHLLAAATFNQATSVEGAMFQIGVAFDGLQEIADDLPPDFRERLGRIDRALYSAARGLEASTGAKSPAMSRLIPQGSSPLGPSAKGNIVALVRG